MTHKLCLAALFFFGCLTSFLLAQPVLSLTPTPASGLSSPIQVVNAGDGSNRFFVVQKNGAIRVYGPGFNFLGDFLNVSNIGGSFEGGLLSMAFHPDYPDNGLFYVYYTNTVGSLELARYHVSDNDPNEADPNSKVVVLTIPHPGFESHNGGELHFGKDGHLYLSTGDGGNQGDPDNNAQNKNILLGKLLRMAVDTTSIAPYYTIPPDNPYGNEVAALGLRNPFRWSFDRLTSDLWIGDVGYSTREEISFRASDAILGSNFGWSCYEGDVMYNTNACHPDSQYIAPVFAYYSLPPVSVIGGLVYRGLEYPDLQGYYFAVDYYSGNWYALSPDGNGGWNTTIQTLPLKGIVDFGESESGEVYVVSITENKIYRLGQMNSGTKQTIGVSPAWVSVYPNLLREGPLYLDFHGNYCQSLRLVNTTGKTVFYQDLDDVKSVLQLSLPPLPNGLYFLQLNSKAQGVAVKKIQIMH